LRDINQALEEIVINLVNITSCDGEVIIDDKLNPIKTQFIKNISGLLNHEHAPRINPNSTISIQDQIDGETVSTGQYFQIKLDQSTFFDEFTPVENLNYQLVFIENDKETALPSWLSFRDMTLMGTAPETIFGRDFEFKLIVKNEFQEDREPLKLHVNLSSGFLMKLLLRYSPYILSLVGLIISANKIFNVVCKKIYKHPRDFHVKIDEKVGPETIFPISFIADETQEAKKILRFLERKVAFECKSRSVTRSQLLDYFMKERSLDKVKILETVNESLKELTNQEKETLEFYLKEHQQPRVLLIDQIIINTLTRYHLYMNEERETKILYKKIKKHWTTFIEWDSSISAFKLNHQEFNKIVNMENSSAIDENSLLLVEDNKGINIEMLKDAMLAYAFKHQNINTQPMLVQFNVKEKIKSNFWKRLLKLDLLDCPFSEKGKIGYGIRYSKEYNTLHFSGIVKPDIQNKIVVFQIKDLRHQILKELWIYGGDDVQYSNEFRKSFIYKNEQQARGNDYEVY